MATKKPAPKKAIVKKNVKVAVKKAAAKPAPKKATAKPVAKKVVAKPVAKKVAVKPVAKKATVKPVAKKAAVKPVAKKEIKVEKIKQPKVIKEKIPKIKKADKKSKPTKTVITSSNNSLPKKIDAFKTNTFATSNLKNESGKVIAHRRTEDMKRQNEDTGLKKYEPEHKRSILDNTNADTSPSYRYSDDDLVEFKEIIQRKLDTAKTELQYLQGVIMRKDEGGTEDTENKYQGIEDGSAAMDREQFTQLAGRQISFITHLEQALMRIENKTYGICRETGKLIDKARLRAVPHATLSIEAKNKK